METEIKTTSYEDAAEAEKLNKVENSTGAEKPAKITHRNKYTPQAVKVKIEADAPQEKPQPRSKAPDEGRGIESLLKKGVSRVLIALFTTLLSYLPHLVLLFFTFNIIRAAVESTCKIPGASYVFPSCISSEDGNQKFNALDNLQSRLVHVQEISANGMTLPMQLEYSKNVVREVASIVRYSKVPSRDKMYDTLSEFWQLTDSTGDGIGDFLQGVDRMVDSAITRNEITLRNLKRIAMSRTEPVSIGSQVVAVLFHAPLTVEGAVRRQYLEHLDKLTGDIDLLILNSQLLEANLKHMSDLQWNLRDLILGDSQLVTEQEQEVQGRFWTWFGGYKGLLADFQQQAAVLQGLDLQREWAVDLVSDVTQSLKLLRKKLGDLRIRLQEPGLDMSGDLDFQIAIIQKSVDNLKAGKTKSQSAKQQSIADIKRQIDAKRG